MDSRIVGKVLYFWVFMLGVVLIGKFAGFMEDGKTTIIVCVAAALVYIVWNVFRAIGKRKREEREWLAKQEAMKSKKGNKRR